MHLTPNHPCPNIITLIHQPLRSPRQRNRIHVSRIMNTECGIARNQIILASVLLMGDWKLHNARAPTRLVRVEGTLQVSLIAREMQRDIM